MSLIYVEIPNSYISVCTLIGSMLGIQRWKEPNYTVDLKPWGRAEHRSSIGHCFCTPSEGAYGTGDTVGSSEYLIGRRLAFHLKGCYN